jgi:microcystin degradation protein MlrC
LRRNGRGQGASSPRRGGGKSRVERARVELRAKVQRLREEMWQLSRGVKITRSSYIEHFTRLTEVGQSSWAARQLASWLN